MPFTLVVVLGTMLTGSCASVTEAPTQIIQDVNAKEAFDLIQEHKGNPRFVIIDVRTPEEFAEGHIANAVNIDFRAEDFRSEIGQLDKGNIHFIYCRSGNRSRGALEIMIELGFVEVYHLSTGIIGWLDEGLPTVK